MLDIWNELTMEQLRELELQNKCLLKIVINRCVSILTRRVPAICGWHKTCVSPWSSSVTIRTTPLTMCVVHAVEQQ